MTRSPGDAERAPGLPGHDPRAPEGRNPDGSGRPSQLEVIQETVTETAVKSVAFSPDGEHLLMGTFDRLSLWRPAEVEARLGLGEIARRRTPRSLYQSSYAF